MSIPANKTLEEIRQDLFSKIVSVQAEGWLPARLNLNKGVIRGLIELWAWGLFQLYQFLIMVFGQLFPSLATGKWLDLHCAQVGVVRQAATKALGRVNFYREDTADNISIRKGMIIRTRMDGAGLVHRFVTTEEVVFPSGAESLSVAVESEDYGRQANVTPGMICEISTVIPGVDGVVNTDDWLVREAVDWEKDEELRERYTLAWKDINGSTKYAYESWARGVSGVVAAKIMDRHPRGQGTVDVIVKGSAGIPTDELIQEVDTVVQENRPINDDVQVLEPVPVPVAVNAELVLIGGTPDIIIAEATQRINAMFTDPRVLPDVDPLEIGQDLPRDLLIHIIKAVSGIKKINFTSPAADIPVPENGLAVLESINLTYAWAGEA